MEACGVTPIIPMGRSRKVQISIDDPIYGGTYEILYVSGALTPPFAGEVEGMMFRA